MQLKYFKHVFNYFKIERKRKRMNWHAPSYRCIHQGRLCRFAVSISHGVKALSNLDIVPISIIVAGLHDSSRLSQAIFRIRKQSTTISKMQPILLVQTMSFIFPIIWLLIIPTEVTNKNSALFTNMPNQPNHICCYIIRPSFMFIRSSYKITGNSQNIQKWEIFLLSLIILNTAARR